MKTVLLSLPIAAAHLCFTWLLLWLHFDDALGLDKGPQMLLFFYPWTTLTLLFVLQGLRKLEPFRPYYAYFYSVKSGILFLILLVLEVIVHKSMKPSNDFHLYTAMFTASVPSFFAMLRIGVALNILERPE